VRHRAHVGEGRADKEGSHKFYTRREENKAQYLGHCGPEKLVTFQFLSLYLSL
jgi:hypothetical protein